MEKAAAAAGEDAIADERDKATPSSSAVGAPSPKKCKTAAVVDAGASGAARSVPDDVVRNILARLPARTAVACTALSKHHGGLIRGPEFRSLHRRLGAPLPRPHIAYVATAPVWRRPDQKSPTSRFVGFHVAGATPMRSITGRRYLGLIHVNTCNGVVLLASEGYTARCRCILWNPAVADVVEEVTLPDPLAGSEYLLLGLGYGQRSETYKLLLVCRKTVTIGHEKRHEHSLITYELGDAEMQPTELSAGGDNGVIMNQEDSLYIDGKIYLTQKNSAILVFDVDEEGVTSLDVPVEHHPVRNVYIESSKLMEMSGRPCVVAVHGRDCALWLLSGDHQWERRFLIGELRPPADTHLSSIKGVWDCGGVLVLYLDNTIDEEHNLFLYDVSTKKMFKAKLHQDSAPPEWSEFSDYVLCWGYRPSLVSPSSIVSKPNQDKEPCRECSADIMKALKPIAEQDKVKGQQVTLDTVCFMDFLVRIMQKLPKDLQQVLEMTMTDSDDPDFSFENVPFADYDL